MSASESNFDPPTRHTPHEQNGNLRLEFDDDTGDVTFTVANRFEFRLTRSQVDELCRALMPHNYALASRACRRTSS